MPDPQTQDQSQGFGSLVDSMLSDIRKGKTTDAAQSPAVTPPPGPTPQQPQSTDPNSLPLDQWADGMLRAVRQNQGKPDSELPETMRYAGVTLRPEVRADIIKRMNQMGVAPRHPPEQMTDGELKANWEEIAKAHRAQSEAAGATSYPNILEPSVSWLPPSLQAPVEKYVVNPAEKYVGKPYEKYVGEPLRAAGQKYIAPVLEAALHDPASLGSPAAIGKLSAEAAQFASMTDEDRRHASDELAARHPSLAKIQQAYGAFAHGAAGGAAGFIADPINWALMATGGIAEKAFPVAAFAADAMFSGLMSKGLWDSSVDAGHKLANGDMYGAFEDLGGVPMQAYFLGHGLDKFESQVRVARLTGRLEDASQQTFSTAFKDLDAMQRYDIVHDVLEGKNKLNPVEKRMQEATSDDARVELGNRRVQARMQAMQETLEDWRNKPVPPTEDQIADLRQRITEEATKRAQEQEAKVGEQGFRDLGQRTEMEPPPSLVEGAPVESTVPILEGSPLTPEQKFAQAEEEAWKLVHEGRADEALHLMSLYDEWLRERPEAREGRAIAQREGEMKRLADDSEKEEERITAERGFKDLGRRQTEEAPTTPTPSTPPPLAPPTGIQPPPKPTEAPVSAPAAKPEPVRESPEVAKFEQPGSTGMLNNSPTMWGGRGEAVTPKDTRVAFQYAVVPASAVNTSFDETFKVNPNYPGELQPRDRMRAASQDQFLSLTSPGQSQLDFLRMSESANAGDGAPIVGTDLNAETRNMGTTALKTLYERSSPISSQYRDALIQNASKFGLDSNQVAQIENPVLVRVRRTPMSMDQRSDFAQEANTPTTARMGATEVAKLDSQKLDQSVLGLLQPTSDGSINNAANYDFVRQFIASISSPSERGAYMQPDGSLSIEGINRIRNALFAKAYPGAEAITAQMAESSDSNIKNMQNAMHGAAPRFAIMQDMIDRGILHDFAITTDIGDAAKKLSELRRTGKSVEDYLGQQSLGIMPDMSNAAKELLRAINDKGRSVRGLTQILSDYADAAMARGRTDQSNIFGDQGPVITKEDILKTVTRQNSLLDFGDQPPAPTPEPAPPPKVETMTPPPGSATAGFPPASELKATPELIAQARENVKSLSPKQITRELKSAIHSFNEYKDGYDDIRERGIDAVLELSDQNDLDHLAENFGLPEDASPKDVESVLRANADTVVRKALEMYRDSAMASHADQVALSELAGKEAPAAKGASKTTGKITNAQILAEAYKPGNIVKSYSGYDRVIDFVPGDPSKPYPDNNWRVKVIATDQNGTPIPGERERTHSTQPEKSDLVAAKKRLESARAGEGQSPTVTPPPGTPALSHDEMTARLQADSESLSKRLLGADLTQEQRGVLRRQIDENNKMLAEMQSRSGQEPSTSAAEKPVAFKASKKGGYALIGVNEAGREEVFREFSKEFLKNNKDKIIATYNQQDNPYMVVDDKGGLVAQSRTWQLRQGDLTSAEKLKTLSETEVKTLLDDVRSRLAAAPPGTPNHDVLTRAAANLEDDMTRRRDESPAKPGFGSQNVLVSQEEMEAARKRLRDKANTQYSGLDPEIVADLTKMGAYYVEAGIRDLATWTAQMVKDFGEFVRPYLENVWQQLPNAARQMAEEKKMVADPQLKEALDKQVGRFETVQEGQNARPGGAATGTSGAVGETVNAAVENQGRGNTPPPLSATPESEVLKTAPTGTLGDGQGVKPSRSPADLTLDAPSSVRGVWRVAPEDWRRELRASGLAESAPGPSITLSPAVDSALIYRPQKPIVEMALSELEHGSGSFVVASSTGTGKTVIGAAVVREILDRNPGRQYVITLTKNDEIMRTWRDWYAKFGIEALKMPQNVTAPPEPGVYLTTYATLRERPGMERFPWNVALYDEASEMRNWQTSKQGAAGKALSETAEKNLYLSATPFSSAVELGYLESLGLWREQGFEKWAKDNKLGVTRDARTNLLSGGNAPLRLAQLREQLIQRGQFINLDTDLSGHRFSVGVVPLADGQWQTLRNIDNAFTVAENYFTRRNQSGLIMSSRAARVNYMKAYLERTRLPQAIEIMKKLDAAGFKVAVFSETMAERQEIYDFLKPLDAALDGKLSQMLPGLPGVYTSLHEAFGDQVANLSGSGSKSQEIKDFNTNAKKHIYATYQKGGMGVSLHDTEGNAPRAAIYLGPPWSGMLLQQGLGRIWRFGTNSDAYSIILGSDSAAEFNTITQRVVSRLESMHALVSGIDKENPTVQSMRSIEDAEDYALGNEDKTDREDLATRANTAGISNYKDIEIPNAEGYKNKGLQVERRDIQPPPGARTLFSGEEGFFDPKAAIQAARDLANNITRLNTKIKSAFVRGDEMEQPPDPNDPDQRALDMTVGTPSAKRVAKEAFEGEDPEVKSAFVNAAQSAAAEWAYGSPGSPTAAVVGSWRSTLDLLRDAERTGTDIAGVTHDVVMSNVRQMIARRGGDIGKDIVKDILNYNIIQGNTVGPWNTRIMGVVDKYGLSKSDFSNLWHSVEGVEQPANGRVAAAVPEMRKFMADIAADTREAGVMTKIWDPVLNRFRFSPIGDDPNYMPHMYDKDAFKVGTQKRNEIIQKIMQRDGVSLSAAEQIIQRFRSDTPLAGTIERPRQYNMPGYRKDMDAFLDYLNQAAEVIARTKVFGQAAEKLHAAVSLIPAAEDRQIVLEGMKQVMSYQPWKPRVRAFLTGATNITMLTKMINPTTVIKMASHWLRPSIHASLDDYGRALIKTIASYPRATAAAIDVGAINRRSWMQMYPEMVMGRQSVMQFWGTVTGGRFIDNFGRALANETARNVLERGALPALIENPSDEHWRGKLDRIFQIPPEMIDKAIADRAWSRDALARAGKAYSDKTQFTNDPTELPAVFRDVPDSEATQWVAAAARTSLQLKSVLWRNTYFFHDALISEAKAKNYKPWIPFLTLFPAAGGLLYSLASVAKAKSKEEMDKLWDSSWSVTDGLHQMAMGMGTVAAGTIFSSLFEAIENHGAAGGVLSWLAGPTLNDAGRTVEDVVKGSIGTVKDILDGNFDKALTSFPNTRRWTRQTVPVTQHFIEPPAPESRVSTKSSGFPSGMKPPPRGHSHF